VVGSCEYGDEPSASGATDLVRQCLSGRILDMSKGKYCLYILG
jgi:hypothetical protein